METRMSSFSRDLGSSLSVEPREAGVTARTYKSMSKRFAQREDPVLVLSDSALSAGCMCTVF